MVEKMVKPELVWVKVMCGEFGEVTAIIGLVIISFGRWHPWHKCSQSEKVADL